MIGNCLYCNTEFRKRERTRKFCSLHCSSRSNRNGLRDVILPKEGIALAEFVGICLGDGCTTIYQVSVTLNATADKEYIPYVSRLMERLFPQASISLVRKVKDNAIDVRVNSRIVADFMKSVGIVSHAKTIPSWVLKNRRYTQACVRGLFDTEGSISFKRYVDKSGGIRVYKQLNFRNIDKKLLLFIRDHLVMLGLKPTTTLNNYIYLSNDDAIDMYREKVGFSNPKLLRRSFVRSQAELEMIILNNN